MEEIFLGETRDDEAGLQTRAAELLRQLGENDHPNPSDGPSSLGNRLHDCPYASIANRGAISSGAATGIWSVSA